MAERNLKRKLGRRSYIEKDQEEMPSSKQKTTKIQSYKPSNQDIKIECDKHGQKLNLYCPSHLIPCCDECISTSHSKCTGIKSLASVVKKAKVEKSKESVETDINYILPILEKLVNKKSKNITGEHQYIDIKRSIGEIRNEINNHLDHIEKKLCKESDTIWNQEKLKAADFISEIEENKKKLKEMKENLQTVTSNTSKLQSFLGVHRIEQQVHQCQQYVDNLKHDVRAKEFDIKIKHHEDIDKILSKLGSLEVIVVRTDTNLNKETSVRKEAQVDSREQSNINNLTMKIESQIKIDTQNCINDMICLMDGRIIVVERCGPVYLLTSDTKFVRKLPLSDEKMNIWNVTQIDQNKIAFTFRGAQNEIKIFNLESETFTKIIELNKICWGLSCSNNSLAVGLANNEVRILNLEGNTLRSIPVQSRSNLTDLVYRNDRIIYIDSRDQAVNCVDRSGKQIWQYKQELEGPSGLCTDTYGNVIVSDRSANRIILISKYLQESKVLMSREDGLDRPIECISCKHNVNEPSGVICDFKGKFFAKFTLSYG